MRHTTLLMLLLAVLAAPAVAQDAGEKPAGKAPTKPVLEPLPEPPPPPPGVDLGADEPAVVIKKRDEDLVEEHRINGKLYMMKVTPKYGPPYYLVDDRGDGTFSRQESTDSGHRPPRWVIGTF